MSETEQFKGRMRRRYLFWLLLFAQTYAMGMGTVMDYVWPLSHPIEVGVLIAAISAVGMVFSAYRLFNTSNGPPHKGNMSQ